ncbi:putative EXPERA domain-containing protein [Seiridium cardinale]
MTAVVPASISTQNVYQDWMFHQTGALFLMVAINTGVLLRYASDMNVWRIAQRGILAVDLILLWAQYQYMDQQGRLELAAWRFEDWSCAVLTLFVAVLRSIFLLNVGIETEKDTKKTA